MTQKNKRFIIGLTGTNAAGKGVVSKVLQAQGYVHYSLSDVVRKEASARGLPDSRENLIRVANDLRRTHGPQIMATRTIAAFSAPQIVVDSVRSPYEVAALKKSGSFLLIGIDAPIALRFQRACQRGRQESAQTLKDFEAIEKRERTKDPDAQQLDQTLQEADCILINDTDIASLEKKVLALLKEKNFPQKPA